MILEVNNTFDERRIYFLESTGPDWVADDESSSSGAATSANESPSANLGPRDALTKSTRFVGSWAKDFHVSPFNSRKGAYAVSAEDPLAQGKIDNTITLSSSKGHPKLVARIFSTNPCVDPSEITSWETFRFVLAWWWVGFVTFPRILREAAKLFFLRKLHVWYRPEVFKESIGRQATEDER